MPTQVLKDKHGSKIGEIREMSGKLVIYDKHGSKKGEYDPKLNVTKDHHGSKVGHPKPSSPTSERSSAER